MATESLHSSPLPSDFQTEKPWTDLKLLFDDGKALYIAKATLAQASPVFCTMLCEERWNSKKDDTLRELHLPAKSSEHFLNFLRCLVSIHTVSPFRITAEAAPGVLPLADEYDICWLKEECMDVLKDTWRIHESLTQFSPLYAIKIGMELNHQDRLN